jgi:hypothetical protein
MRKAGNVFALVFMFLFAASVLAVSPSGSAAASAGTEAKKDTGEKNEKKAEKHRKSRSYADKIRGRFARPHVKPKKKPKYKNWSEVTKDAEIKKGLFKVYKKREDVYFEIEKDQLDKPFLAVLSMSKGIGARFVLGGLPIDDIMFDFHRVEDHVQIRRLNTLFRSSGDEAVQKAIDLTFGNSILFSLKIESENDETGALLLKMNDVFLSDLPDLAYWMRLVLRKPVRLDSKRRAFGEIKVFPGNVELEAMLTYVPGDRRGLYLPSVPDPRYIEVGVHYSIINLPEKPMEPRLADDRIGYFLTPFKDFTRDDSESFMVHYINRWRLEKKDSTAALSEPKKPIVFYLDRTIPKKYRRFVAAGIEEWQKAFEEAGFKNAILAKEAPDDPDFDPEDARYNTIRWIVTDSPSFGAIGPSRVDPRTGEILDADILLDGNMVAGFKKVYRRYAGPDAVIKTDPFLRFIDHPLKDPNDDPVIEFYRNNKWFCSIGRGIENGGAFMRLVMLANGELAPGMDVPEEYIGEALKEVTMHEVGHTLGLRHNFKSSVAVPYDKLNDRETIARTGMTGSVMDYASPNIARDRSRQGYYYSPTVGPCDKWMIKWGYMEVPGDTPEEKKEVLEKIAAESWKPEYAYGTDEDTYPAGALDPLCNIWDLGDDPLRFGSDRIALIDDLLHSGKLEKRVVENGQGYAALRTAVQTLFIQRYIASIMGVKYVGGQYTSRSHKGDPGGKLPFEPVPASEQRRAMNFLVKNAFSPDGFALPPEVLNKLSDPKLNDWENNLFSYGRRFDFPLIEWVSALQYSVLANLMQPYLLQRIVDAEYKVKNPYRLSEFFRSLSKAIWLDQPVAEGRTAAMRRNLQRHYLGFLIKMVVRPFPGTPQDAIALARLNLRRIQARIDEAFKKPGLSDEANAHLLESRARIARALEAKLQSSF